MIDCLWDTKKLKLSLESVLVSCIDSYICHINNVVFDSRKIKDSSLFVARKGKNDDGHNYISDVLKKYENTVVLADVNSKFENKNNSRVILVKDVELALKKMAEYARKIFKGEVIGVTGSLGKTTTKELLYSCLSNYGKSYHNYGNYNNYSGCLHTLCNLPENCDFAIIEMGMDKKGEIETISNLVKPNNTIITNVELAHSEFFNSEKEIAIAKSEIFIHQQKNGYTILNKNNKYFNLCKEKALENKINEIISFGKNTNSDISLLEYKQKNDLYFAKYKIYDKYFEYSFKNPDFNIAINLMPTLAVMYKNNFDFNQIHLTLENFETPRGRNNIEHSIINNKRLTIINGSYNAVNPLTFVSGFEILNKISSTQKINRKIAIFGDIRESGNNAETFMLSLEPYIIKSKIDLLICVGDYIEALYNSIKDKVKSKYFKTYKDVIPIIKDIVEDNDLIFIKSSFGIKSYKILNEISNNPMEY